LSFYLAVGTVADKVILPAGAMVVGSLAGILSTTGFHLIKPALQKFRVHDTCGVNNLHGMPGLLAGIFGIILALFPTFSRHSDNLLATCWHSDQRSYLVQFGYQTLALVSTIIIAVASGLLTGAILRLPILNDDFPSSYFNDYQHWETPDDFDHGAPASNDGPGEL
jgi:ammonium transporter Rh